MRRVGFLRPRDGISITHTGDNPVLFDSQKQHLYAVDELTARAWRRVCAKPTGIGCQELAGLLVGSPELEGRPPSELIKAWLNTGIFGSYESPRDLIALAIGYEVCHVDCPAELGLEVRKLFRNLITNLPNAGNYTSVSIDNDELGFSLTRNKTFRGSYSGDPDHHLVEVPSIARAWAAPPQLSCNPEPKFEHPAPHRFVGNLQ